MAKSLQINCVKVMEYIASFVVVNNDYKLMFKSQSSVDSVF